MRQYNFDEHPHIQHCMRRIAMYSPLTDKDVAEMLEALSDVLAENLRLQDCESVCECGAFT